MSVRSIATLPLLVSVSILIVSAVFCVVAFVQPTQVGSDTHLKELIGAVLAVTGIVFATISIGLRKLHTQAHRCTAGVAMLATVVAGSLLMNVNNEAEYRAHQVAAVIIGATITWRVLQLKSSTTGGPCDRGKRAE